MKLAHLLFGIIPFAMTLPGASAAQVGPHPIVHIKTNMGEIVVQLDHEKAPVTVDNFIKYVQSGFYDGTIFHRVIPGFMVQGGGYTENFDKKPTQPPIKIEADNGLKNDRGTVAMARTMDPDSATAQFFINLVDNDFLNYKSSTMEGWGYTVFGKVIKGMDVVDSIAKEPTGRGGPFPKDVPQKPMVIEKVTLEEPAGGK